MYGGSGAGFARATDVLGEVRKGAVEAPSEMTSNPSSKGERSDHGAFRGPVC